MGLNEEEIPSVSDKSPVSAKQHKINSKRTVKSILADIPPPLSSYKPISIDDRPPRSLVNGLVDTPLGFFQLFITTQLCRTIAYHTNIKAHDHTKKEKKNNHRPWYDTIGPEIEVFLGILLFLGMNHAPATEDYWNQCPDKPIFLSIHKPCPSYDFNKSRDS